MPEKKVPDFDYDIVDPNATEQSIPAYPVAQWYNGKQALKSAGGVQYCGGIVLPTKYLPGGVVPDGWKIEGITFGSGKEETAATTQKIIFAPIRSRFHWFAKQGEETIYYPRNAYVAGANMRGHLQVLSAIHGIDEPIVITFKGKASQAFKALLKDFDTKVTRIANRTAPKGKPLPRYAFWMTIIPGAHSKAGKTGQESVVTPPSLALPADITKEYLLSCYVGRENLVRYQEVYGQADMWVNAWEADVEMAEN
jgi:hypothetical protein